MARLAISKDYFPAYARLPRKAQRKADEFLVKFQRDSTASALHVEPIHALDPQLRSARIGDDYRVILRAPETGDVYLVLWVDHHDEAYRWAASKQTAIHPATGTLQIFDAQLAARALTEPPPPEEISVEVTSLPPGIFAPFTDDDLFLAGVPRPLLPSVRSIASDEDLDRLLPHLPVEAGEVLTGLAAGVSLDQALEEVLGRVAPPVGAPTPPAVDVSDVAAALEREPTQRQFRLFDGSLDLDAALKHPLDVWRVFLHPRQRRLAHARTKGPTRVLGGAGTGKTVVALHRAAFLVREVFTKPDDKVLFTTFTVNLAQDLRAQLAKILEPDQLARVEVTNIDKWVFDYLRRRGVAVRVAYEDDQREHFRSAFEIYGSDEFTVDFARAEWREVVQDQGITTEQEYVLAVRRYRGTPLSRADRRKLWPVFAAYRDQLEQNGLFEPLDMIRRARQELEKEGGLPRYQSVVVDETQDFFGDALKLVRAIAGPERPDDLFLVGDAHQRIYGRPVSLSSCGIQVRGRRSQTLRLNYRTTGAICRWSFATLSDVDVDDLDEGRADRRGYVSLREGAAPVVRVSKSQADEERDVVAIVRDAITRGVPPESICVIARTHGPLKDRFEPALTSAGIDAVILEQDEPRRPAVRLATMHRVKGLEFPVVVLAGASKDSLPFPSPELRSDDPVVASAALLREKCLVYVAASRARDELYVTAAGTLTSLLPKPAAAPPPPKVERPATKPPPRPETDPLDTQLASLSLPTRMANWIDAHELTTVRELVSLAPSELLAERNLGRGSIGETRAIIEQLLGAPWESFLTNTPTEGPQPPAAPPGSWDALRLQLNDEQKSALLSDIELPARVRTYVETQKLVTLGELAERSAATMTASPNLSRRSVADLPPAINEHFARVERDRAIVAQGLFEGFRTLVQQEEPMLRIIVTRRSGMAGEAETLQSLGDTFGITRERIRQLEAKVARGLARRLWGREVAARVRGAIAGGAVPLAALAKDAWWSSAAERPEVLHYIVETVLDGFAYVIEWDEEAWLSPAKLSAVQAAWSKISSDAEKIALPAAVEQFDSLVEKRNSFGAELGARLADRLREQLQIDNGRVVALGGTRRAEALAILRASLEPMRADEVFERMGTRVHFPEEVVHFGRGVVGLEQHIPDFAKWRQRLAEPVRDLISQAGPTRQWSCNELLDELREEIELPAWFTPWHLAAVVRRTEGLVYLGRLRVALPGTNEGDDRVFVHEAAEQILRAAGGPLGRDELISRIRARTGASAFTFMTLFARPQFVRTSADEIGLLDRDVPGGASAIADAIEHVEGVLERRDRGLSAFHVHEEVRGLSADHARWTEELTYSVLRSDGRFRASQSGAVGLASWESVRVPTRLELARAALEEAGGRVSVEAIMARIEAHFGARPTRATLAGIAMHLGAGLDGDWIVRRGGSEVRAD